MFPLSQSWISEVEFERLDQYFSLTFKFVKTVGEAGEVLEKSLNFTHTCLYEPCLGLLYQHYSCRILLSIAEE